MPEPKIKTAGEVLRILVERVRRIESDAKMTAAIMERMIEKIERNKSAG